MTFTSVPLQLTWDQELPIYWFDNSPFKTHFMNSLSNRFNNGEKFLISSMKKYQSEITDEDLKKEIKEFIAQESWHRRVHSQFDKWLDSKGYSALEISERSIDEHERLNKNHPRHVSLSVSYCLEHMFTVTAEHFLNHSELLDSMHPHFKKIWQWHCIEEIEHKSVAINVLNHFEKRLKYEKLLHIYIIILIFCKILFGTFSFLKKDKLLFKFSTYKDAFIFFFNSKNGFLKILKPYFRFFEKNWHPNNINHDKLLERFSK